MDDSAKNLETGYLANIHPDPHPLLLELEQHGRKWLRVVEHDKAALFIATYINVPEFSATTTEFCDRLLAWVDTSMPSSGALDACLQHWKLRKRHGRHY